MVDRRTVKGGRHARVELLHAGRAFLPGDSDVPDADVPGLGPVRTGPDARVLARIDRHDNARSQLDPFAPGDADHAVEWDAGLLKETHRFVAPDQRCTSLRHYPFGSPQMVKVRVPDDDPIARVDVVGPESCARSARCSIDVGVEKQGQSGGLKPERRATE